MNELDKAAQQCWALAATERFDIAGEIALQIDIAAPPAATAASVIRDTAHNAKLSACLIQLMAGYRWAPPLYGQAIQLPFQFRAPDGQNTIDRALVAWNGQGNGKSRASVAVLLDEASTGSAAASMFELAIAAGGTTGMRRTERAELWYFLAAGEVVSPGGGRHPVAAGDMMYVPRGGAREVAAPAGELHAMIVVVPGGREGAARSGALPTPELGASTGGPRPKPPVILPASAARTHGPATIYTDGQIPDRTFAASVLNLPAGAELADHVHTGEAELLYVLAGSGTLTVNGVALPVTPTSVAQIPKATRHAFVAATACRAVQIFTPAAPEQRYKAPP
ncbi:MAG TPA: cupin domain-containing protein [Kofleriaceae bacterium]|jgi:quercetin dioxygenase-like cupin family protein|nr:cupin domain-containing protein [Kofleriaceae bacterium]